MPARDTHHEALRNALIKEGWRITHDPYTLSFGNTDVYVDLGAERTLAAERGEEKIAVELKSFRSASVIRDVENAVGQFVFYRSLLTRAEPGRKLFLAVPIATLLSTFEEPIVRPVVEDQHIALVAFDPNQEVIIKWLP